MEADTLSKIITESGPLAGMIVLLGVLIKAWFQDSKRTLEKLSGQIENIHKELNANDTAIKLLDNRVENLETRVGKIESKVDGVSRPIDVRG